MIGCAQQETRCGRAQAGSLKVTCAWSAMFMADGVCRWCLVYAGSGCEDFQKDLDIYGVDGQTGFERLDGVFYGQKPNPSVRPNSMLARCWLAWLVRGGGQGSQPWAPQSEPSLVGPRSKKDKDDAMPI